MGLDTYGYALLSRPWVFEKLEKEVIPRLFNRKSQQDAIRVWPVGCATGEEAYSLAIALKEAAGKFETPPQIQVFASDLHARSLTIAREGFYSGDIETDVSAERLKRFFTPEIGGFRIRQELRDLVIFAPHNILSDPPFSRMDLSSGDKRLCIFVKRNAPVRQPRLPVFPLTH